MEYIAILGRQPKLSIAELESLYGKVEPLSKNVVKFTTDKSVNIDRLGGTIKLATPIDDLPFNYLLNLPAGKLTFGLSDYSDTPKRGDEIQKEVLTIKRRLAVKNRSARIVLSQKHLPVLATAEVVHNRLGQKPTAVELIRHNNNYYRQVGVQDINAYSRRDYERPARDARVGMLPPKLAQILINLAGDLPEGSTILDPFCGTGVVLQEALLMNYLAYGTDLDHRMIYYSRTNLDWLLREKRHLAPDSYRLAQGDATTFKWQPPISAIASEIYLGPPLTTIPDAVKLMSIKAGIQELFDTFLKNLAPQLAKGTPVVLAIPAWATKNGKFTSLSLDEIEKMGYNVINSAENLLYHREGQIVARKIIRLRKK